MRSPVSDPAIPSPAAESSSSDTATRILDAAEALFVEHGFAATSVRAIAARAEVNLGATHYHFGSKEGLLGAVIHRRVAPINVARLELLAGLEATEPAPGARAVLGAFFAPLRGSGTPAVVPRLMGRLFGEPERISRPLIERQFGETFERFTAALARAMPGVGSQEIRWRFHFAIGAMIHQLRTGAPPATPSDPDAIGQLIEFAVAGIERDPRAPQQEPTP